MPASELRTPSQLTPRLIGGLSRFVFWLTTAARTGWRAQAEGWKPSCHCGLFRTHLGWSLCPVNLHPGDGQPETAVSPCTLWLRHLRSCQQLQDSGRHTCQACLRGPVASDPMALRPIITPVADAPTALAAINTARAAARSAAWRTNVEDRGWLGWVTCSRTWVSYADDAGEADSGHEFSTHF